MNNKENIVKKIIGIDKKYITINPLDFEKGHGGGLSVKIVLPCYCQAKCPFCFNKLTINTQKHNYDEFFDKLPKSLDMIFNSVKNRPITLDITGNEPTFNIVIFSKLMDVLRKYKDKTQKVVLTTNGFKLEKCIDSMIGVVDIVNISLHHYYYEERKNIFNTSFIPNDIELKNIISKLKLNNITCTSVAVLYKERKNFKEFFDKFIKWSNDLGFKDTRMRSNFCSSDQFIDDILNDSTNCKKIDRNNPLTIKLIKNEELNYETYILKGVQDLTEYNLGFEIIIDDDGLCYADYNKRFLIDESKVDYFNYGYIFED